MDYTEQRPSKYIELCPDLAALVNVAWKSTFKSSNQLHATSYLRTSEAAANSVEIGEGASFLVTRKTRGSLLANRKA